MTKKEVLDSLEEMIQKNKRMCRRTSLDILKSKWKHEKDALIAAKKAVEKCDERIL